MQGDDVIQRVTIKESKTESIWRKFTCYPVHVMLWEKYINNSILSMKGKC